MATQTKTNPADAIEKVTERVAELNQKAAQEAQKAAERAAELNQKAVENGKKAGAAYLDSYEQAVLTLTDSLEKAAQSTKVEWIESVASVQATLVREATQAQTAAARELVG